MCNEYITPVICKYPFWQMTKDNPKAVYACLNFNDAYCPVEIEKQSVCIDGDSAVIALLGAGFITGTDLLIDGGVIASIRTGQYKLQ